MKVFARAPMRIDFAGGWSDVPVFADREGGGVAAGAIDVGVQVEFLLGEEKIKLAAEDLGQRVTIQQAGLMTYDGVLDLHKAALNMLPVTGGIEIISRSDAPNGSGLGASGALDVALLAGLALCRNEGFTPDELAELGFRLETQELGLQGGRQDQLTAALGGFHHYQFGEGGAVARPLELSEDQVRDLQEHVVLAYTGESHFSSATHRHVWSAYEADDPGVTAALRAIRSLAAEAATAVADGNWRALAAIIDENWQQQKKLHRSIATPRMARIEEAAREAGAWGAKATGAGAGGCMVFISDRDDHAAVKQAVTAADGRVLDMRFAMDGVRMWIEEDDALADG